MSEIEGPISYEPDLPTLKINNISFKSRKFPLYFSTNLSDGPALKESFHDAITRPVPVKRRKAGNSRTLNKIGD